MPVRDGRPAQESFTLPEHGFAIKQRPTAVTDFSDTTVIDEVYVPETLAAVKDITGATCVAPLGYTVRKTEMPDDPVSQPQASDVHCDVYGPAWGDRGEELYRRHFPDGPGFRRALVTSFWRVINEPPAGLAAGSVRLQVRSRFRGCPDPAAVGR